LFISQHLRTLVQHFVPPPREVVLARTPRRGTQILAKRLLGRVQFSRGVQMATATQEYRNKAATCLQLSKTMDDDNRRRLEDIARRWLELAKEDDLDEQEYLEAAE
jgi:hypothetical protein